MIVRLLICCSVTFGIFFVADWLFGVEWKSYVVGIACAWVTELFFSSKGNIALLPDPSVADDEMAALRKALERQIERDEARDG